MAGAAKRLYNRNSGATKAKDGHEVAVRRTTTRVNDDHATKHVGWWRAPELELQYDPHSRLVSHGDFSEEEIQAMERLYGGRIQRPKPAGEEAA